MEEEIVERKCKNRKTNWRGVLFNSSAGDLVAWACVVAVRGGDQKGLDSGCIWAVQLLQVTHGLASEGT